MMLISEEAIGVTSNSGQVRQTLRYNFRPIGYDASADFSISMPDKRHSRRGSQAFREPLFGGRETGARGSRAAHQPGNAGGRAIDRAILS
jgi:hypothetical protein